MDRRRSLTGLGAMFVLGTMVAACNDDGRSLRPARPDQNATISTLAPETTPLVDDGGIGAVTPTSVLPGFDTIAPPMTVNVTLPGSASADSRTLTAPWRDGAAIDERYTCDGDNVSPALSWSPAPAGTVEIAVSLSDDDAPGFVHWVMAGLDPSITSLGEGAVPEFGIRGLNSDGTSGFTGPCPPTGSDAHTYRFTVHYLRQQTRLADETPGAELLDAVLSTTIASATVSGTYGRA